MASENYNYECKNNNNNNNNSNTKGAAMAVNGMVFRLFFNIPDALHVLTTD